MLQAADSGVIRKIAVKTAFRWDNYLTGGRVLHNLFHLIPPVSFLVALPMMYPDETWTPIATKILYIYVIVVASRLVNEFISSLYAYPRTPTCSMGQTDERSLPDA